MKKFKGKDSAVSAEPAISIVNHEVRRERVARAICTACGENPDQQGDARGNALRWQDYLKAADAAIKAY